MVAGVDGGHWYDGDGGSDEMEVRWRLAMAWLSKLKVKDTSPLYISFLPLLLTF